jgi:hypothetical protein
MEANGDNRQLIGHTTTLASLKRKNSARSISLAAVKESLKGSSLNRVVCARAR